MKHQELRTKLTGDSAFDKHEEHFLVWDHQVGRASNIQHRQGHLYLHFHHNHRHHHHDNHRHYQLPPGGWDEVQARARLWEPGRQKRDLGENSVHTKQELSWNGSVHPELELRCEKMCSPSRTGTKSRWPGPSRTRNKISSPPCESFKASPTQSCVWVHTLSFTYHSSFVSIMLRIIFSTTSFRILTKSIEFYAQILKPISIGL